MSQTITITSEDIISQIKISFKTSELIEDILSFKIIQNAAEQAGITVSDQELQQAADQMRLSQNLKNADDTWEWLNKNYLSLEDFEKLVYKNTLSGKLAVHLFADKIEPYFYEHQLDYVSVVCYEILLEDEDLAMELFYAIQEGEMSFFEVAHKYIENKDLRRKLGYKGKLYRKDLKPEISAAVFAAKPPQLLKPILTSKGAHLILVEEIIQPELNNLLRHKIATELFNDWVKQQIEQLDFTTAL
ncbi:peptidylprolyl isomerase [Nostoc sp. CENA543]|uniref:peptidylprolyl isomerase n=1 Tax=Nostoc sp. CENA543 TaxID=1869241 RepID=UPI000CA3824C|nr:peptidylprolyl isomerase [Nostoc sp. CENA543]AUT03725.1 peptidylprolyl isomerase [Nostoc sp. CENA543]